MINLELSFSTTDSVLYLPLNLSVYTDEQGCSNPDDKTSLEFSVGLLFSPNKIDDDIVKQYRSLREGCTCKKIKQYFHANPDCWVCRTLSGKLVSEYPDNLFYASLRWRHDHSDPKHPTREKLHAHVLALALNSLRLKGVKCIELNYAKIQGLSSPWLEKALAEEEGIAEHVNNVLGLPYMPLSFTLKEVDGSEPGIQLVDRILWQENRSDSKYDLSCLGMIRRDSTIEQKGPIAIRRYSRPGVMIGSVRVNSARGVI